MKTKVEPKGAWFEHQDALNEVVTKAEAIGLTVKPDDGVYPDARLYDAKGRLLTILHYDPSDDTWGCENHSRLFCALDEVMASFEAGNRWFAIYVSYTGGKLPKVSKKTLEAIRGLLPGEPDSLNVLPHEFA